MKGSFVAEVGLRNVAESERSSSRTGLVESLTRQVVRLGLVGLLVFGQSMSAAVIVVEGDCRLVDAITAANEDAPSGACPGGDPGNDTIELTHDVVLTEIDNEIDGRNGLPVVVGEIRIEGNGFSIERSDSAPEFRVLMVGDGGTLELHAVTVANGVCRPCDGGGIRVDTEGRLVVVDSVITRNSVFGGHNHDGGGIWTRGSLDMTDSVVSHNFVESSGHGGGIHSQGEVTLTNSSISWNESVSHRYGGGFYGGGQATIIDSTVSYNTGDGMYVWDAELIGTTVSGNTQEGIVSSGSKTTTLTNSTVSRNGSDGIRLVGLHYACDAGGIVEVTNSSIVGNAGDAIYVRDDSRITLTNSAIQGTCEIGCRGDILDGGSNFATSGSCPQAAPLTGFDPQLRDNGGPTPTHALFTGSSAIDATPCSLDFDQRGIPRADGLCDSGAFEGAVVPPVDPSIVVTAGSCPGRLEFRLSGAAPFSKVSVIGSKALGESVVPAELCEGTELALDAPFLLATFSVDFNGEREEVVAVPRSACGGFVQVLDHFTCLTSGPAQVPR